MLADTGQGNDRGEEDSAFPAMVLSEHKCEAGIDNKQSGRDRGQELPQEAI